MSGTIIKISDLDVSKISFSDPVANSYGGHSINVRYGGQPLLVQTPKMKLPFGMGTYQDEKNPSNVKYSFDFSFAGYELGSDGKPMSPAIRAMHDKLIELDAVLVKGAIANTQAWFPKMEVDDDHQFLVKTLKRNLRPSVKVSKQATKYPPTMKTNIKEYVDKKDGQTKYFGAKFFDADKNAINNIIEYNVPKYSEAIAILRPKVTFNGGDKYGFSWDISQARVFPAQTMPNYGFIDDETDDQPVQTNFKNLSDPSVSQGGDDDSREEQKPSKNYVKDELDELDGDEEEEEEEDPEDEEEEEVPPPKPRTPTPPPQPPKKVVKVNKTKTGK